MAANSFPVTIQTGPNADSYRTGTPALINVASGTTLAQGTPLRRSVTAIQGQNPQVIPYIGINPSLGLNGGDQFVLPNATGGAFVAGVYDSPGVNNIAGTSTIQAAISGLSRQGVTPVLCGAVSGGTAITVGCLVGLSTAAVNTAATTNFATVQAATNGLFLGVVCATAVATTLGPNAVTGVGAATINPPKINGFATSQAIVVNPGGSNQETVTPTTVTAGTLASNAVSITGTSATAAVTYTISLASIPYGIGAASVAIAVASGQTNAQIATSFGAALNTLFASYGAAPANIPGVTGTQPFGLVQVVSSSVVTISAAIPGTYLNSVTLTGFAATSGITATVTNASFGGATAGTANVVVATFASSHAANEPITCAVTVNGNSLCAIPAAGGATVDLVMVDLTPLGA